MVGMDSRKNSGSPIPGLPRRRRDRASQDSSPAFQVQSLHTFGFSVILGRLAQIAVLDSRTVVYAIGSGLHRWRDGFAVPVSTPEDSVESIVAVVASSMGCIVGACELLKSKSSQVSVFDMRTQRKVGTSFIMQCNAEIEICAFSKDETIVVAAAKLEGGGSWLCCWELKHSQEKSADPYMGVAGAHIASGFGPIATIKVPHKMDYIHYFVEGTNLVCITWDTGDDPIVAASLSKDASLAGSVTDMDFCHQRQVIASCGKDNMVRLWSCVTPSCRVAMRYEEEPIAVAIFQYLLIVAFQHRIMCYCLLAHTQTVLKQIPIPNVRHLRISPSGHLASVTAGTTILILCCASWKLLASLKGHRAPITTVAWARNSIHLASADKAGCIHTWFMDGFVGFGESHAPPGSHYTSLLYDPTHLSMYACGPDTPLHLLDTEKKPTSHPGAARDVC
ncbi:uncharacterized protein [Physcomitrium patens]|uniref:uncharacterized protein isoform X2 n=1 Tax=Physcomitrium patens TaxID=3218 RepID=UPI003CCD4BD1